MAEESAKSRMTSLCVAFKDNIFNLNWFGFVHSKGGRLAMVLMAGVHPIPGSIMSNKQF